VVIFDSAALPLVLFRGSGAWDEQDVEALRAGFSNQWATGKKFAVLALYSPTTQPPDARARRLLVDWLNSPQTHDRTKALCVGAVSVVPSAIVRGAITAIQWAWKPPVTFLVQPTTDRALELAVELLTASGVVVDELDAARILGAGRAAARTIEARA
jgi:hypothetical protein